MGRLSERGILFIHVVRYLALSLSIYVRMTVNFDIVSSLKDESQKRETSEMNLKKQENCELRFIYLSEQS